MLELVDVTKVYRGGKRAVDAVTMRLETGMLGLLGPNGAGKSSLMRIASTVTRPTGGRVRFHGTDGVARPGVLRRSLGYLPQDFGVYPNLTSPGVPLVSGRRQGALGPLGSCPDRRAAATGRPHRGGQAAPGHVLRRHAAPGGHRPGAARRPGGRHRRRADRRSRPRGACAVPEPAERTRRGPGRHALHPHRLRRRVRGLRHRRGRPGAAVVPRVAAGPADGGRGTGVGGRRRPRGDCPTSSGGSSSAGCSAPRAGCGSGCWRRAGRTAAPSRSPPNSRERTWPSRTGRTGPGSRPRRPPPTGLRGGGDAGDRCQARGRRLPRPGASARLRRRPDRGSGAGLPRHPGPGVRLAGHAGGRLPGYLQQRVHRHGRRAGRHRLAPAGRVLRRAQRDRARRSAW